MGAPRSGTDPTTAPRDPSHPAPGPGQGKRSPSDSQDGPEHPRRELQKAKASVSLAFRDLWSLGTAIEVPQA